MTEHCEHSATLAPDLALGLLTGVERAEALAHVATCAACRAAVDELSAVGDQLLLLAPTRPAPQDLESRVLATMSARAPRPSRRRALAVAAAVALALVSGVLLGRVTDDRPAQFSAAMVTPAGRDVGRVTVLGGSPGWVHVSVPAWERWDGASGRATTYVLRIDLAGGRVVTLPDVDPDDAGRWASAASVDPAEVQAVSITDPSGHVWCRSQ